MGTPQSYEVNGYILLKNEDDEVDVISKEIVLLRTYLWYFNVKDFDELKMIDKEKVISIINRQLNEKYFYPISYNKVKEYVTQFLENVVEVIDLTISDVREKIPDFTSSIKDIDEIDCILDRECQVTLEYDEEDRLSSYYSLIGTERGHMPVPLFLDYIGIQNSLPSDEEEISLIKNILYFIRGYDKTIPEYTRDYSSIGESVRGAMSSLFQRAVVLYNKIWRNTVKPCRTEDDECCCDDDEYYECPQGTLPDGMGYCREFDYGQLMQKSENELTNEIIESLLKIRERVVKVLEGVKGDEVS